MINDANIQFSISLLSDWAKWLITIETAAIALVGTYIRFLPYKKSSKKLWDKQRVGEMLAKTLATITIISFLFSIAAAALLLLSLPEVALTIRPGMNIWLAKDGVISSLFDLSIQTLAIYESMGFGLGMVCFSTVIIASTWLNQGND